MSTNAGRRMLAATVAVVAAIAVVGLPGRVDAGGVPGPALTAVLEADQTDAIAGEAVIYLLTVTNTGSTLLSDVAVAFSGTPDCDQAINEIPIGEDQVVECPFTTSDEHVGTFANQATITTQETGSVTSNTWSVVVNATVTSLAVSLSADESTVPVGDDIHYHLTIENTGNIGVSNIIASVDGVPDCATDLDFLGVGGDHVVDCSYTTAGDDVPVFSTFATVSSSQTEDVTSNQVDVTVEGVHRPDLIIRRGSGPRVGDDVYSTAPVDQSVVGCRSAGGRITFFAITQNDSGVADRFTVRPAASTAAGAGFRVRYYQGRTNVDITRAVNAGDHRTPRLDPGESSTVRVEVSVLRTTPAGSNAVLDLQARSKHREGPIDRVQARVCVE